MRNGAQLNRFHTLRREQWIPLPVDEVFAFFSDARIGELFGGARQAEAARQV